MRTLHRFATVCVVGAAVAALLPACGSTSDNTGGGAGASSSAGAPSHAGAATSAGAPSAGAGAPSAGAGAPSAGAGAPGVTGDATKGATLYGTQCASCHGPDAAGNQGPNITMSLTAGIGTWTFQQFHDAVRLAQKNGKPLCFLMSAFAEKDVSESGMQDLWAFLKSKPVSDVPNVGSYKANCPP